MSHLVSYYSQIEPNLRRTASKGLISLLNHYQLEDLAFKYFGIKDEYGNITGYQCPYSGKTYTDYKDIILEHIVPVVSNGGTVLFNCIPETETGGGATTFKLMVLLYFPDESLIINCVSPVLIVEKSIEKLPSIDDIVCELG